MSPHGYSGTPLVKKLGIKENMSVLIINKPDDYFQLLGTDISDQMVGKNGKPNLVHVFVQSQKDFINQMKKLAPLYQANSSIIIWVSWYKKASGIATDITEDDIRNYALANDLVDIKVCAVSDIWSGLKLVVQKAKR